MRREYLWASVGLLLGAGLTCVEALRLRYYTPLGPGPGFFPFWLALALGACALGLLLQAIRMPKSALVPSDGLWPDRRGAAKIGAVVASLVVTIFLLEPLGFRLTMLGVYVFLLLALGRRDYWLIAVVALAGSFGVYHLFVDLLQVPLPPGAFGN